MFPIFSEVLNRKRAGKNGNIVKIMRHEEDAVAFIFNSVFQPGQILPEFIF